MADVPSAVFTVGHSTRMLETLIDLLAGATIVRLVDVRTVPRSRTHPQFDRAALPAALAGAGIGYTHLPGLGGLRRPRPDSIHGVWRNASFRGYADHMETPVFAAELEALIALAGAERTAIMCAEAVPCRCHRWLIADALVARGIPVGHLLEAGRVEPHVLTRWARVVSGRVRYAEPPPPSLELDFGPRREPPS